MWLNYTLSLFMLVVLICVLSITLTANKQKNNTKCRNDKFTVLWTGESSSNEERIFKSGTVIDNTPYFVIEEPDNDITFLTSYVRSGATLTIKESIDTPEIGTNHFVINQSTNQIYWFYLTGTTLIAKRTNKDLEILLPINSDIVGSILSFTLVRINSTTSYLNVINTSNQLRRYPILSNVIQPYIFEYQLPVGTDKLFFSAIYDKTIIHGVKNKLIFVEATNLLQVINTKYISYSRSILRYRLRFFCLGNDSEGNTDLIQIFGNQVERITPTLLNGVSENNLFLLEKCEKLYLTPNILPESQNTQIFQWAGIKFVPIDNFSSSNISPAGVLYLKSDNNLYAVASYLFSSGVLLQSHKKHKDWKLKDFEDLNKDVIISFDNFDENEENVVEWLKNKNIPKTINVLKISRSNSFFILYQILKYYDIETIIISYENMYPIDSDQIQVDGHASLKSLLRLVQNYDYSIVYTENKTAVVMNNLFLENFEFEFPDKNNLQKLFHPSRFIRESADNFYLSTNVLENRNIEIKNTAVSSFLTLIKIDYDSPTFIPPEIPE